MQLERILVATDFSDAADRAFDQAVAFARAGDVEVHVLHRLASLVPAIPPLAPPGASTWAETRRQRSRESGSLL